MNDISMSPTGVYNTEAIQNAISKIWNTEKQKLKQIDAMEQNQGKPKVVSNKNKSVANAKEGDIIYTDKYPNGYRLTKEDISKANVKLPLKHKGVK